MPIVPNKKEQNNNSIWWSGPIVSNKKEQDKNVLLSGYELRNQYYIQGVIGQGGFGITYKAYDKLYNRIVAIKELFPRNMVCRVNNDKVVPLANDKKFEHIRDSFYKETNMLVHLQELDDVIRIYHAFNENGTCYYVMEYLDGETLGSYLKKNGPMKWENLSPIVLRIVNSLNSLHSYNVIHRDVSPENIFLLQNGQIKIIDFGNVRSYSEDAHSFTAIVNPGFAPLEQFSAHSHQGPYTDVYSLCATVYYSLTGILPQNAQTRAGSDKMVHLAQVAPSVPKYVANAVMKGLAVKPENRIQSMHDLYKALTVVQTSGKPILQCIRGHYAGKAWYLPENQLFSIGRTPTCNIVYPADSPQVSRVQVEVIYTNGDVYVRDEKSSCGTKISDNTGAVTMQHGAWYNFKGCTLFFGIQEQYCIM